MSGPRVTEAMSRTRTGVPRSPPTAIISMSLIGSDIAAAAHHVFRAAQLDGTAADIVVAHANGIDHAFHRQTVSRQLVRIQIDLVLAHESADAGDFRHAFDAADLIAQVPVLKTAQLSQIVFLRFIDQARTERPSRRRWHRVRVSE